MKQSKLVKKNQLANDFYVTLFLYLKEKGIQNLTTSTIFSLKSGFPSLGQLILWREFVAEWAPEFTDECADKNTRNFPSGLKNIIIHKLSSNQCFLNLKAQ